MIMTRHYDFIDWCVCLLMAAIMCVVFPLGRWIDHAPLSTLLFLGFFFYCYVASRKFCVPMYFKGGRWRQAAFLMLLVSIMLMYALTRFSKGWPFHQLAYFYHEEGKVEMSQQRAWLFFLVVQVVGINIGIMSEMTQQRTRLRSVERDYELMQQSLTNEQQNQQELGKQQMQQTVVASQTISIKSERRNMIICLSEILYIEVKNNYLFLTLTDHRQVKTIATLTSFVSQLPTDEFIRIHKSYVVARSHIVGFNSRQIFIDGIALPIGRSYNNDVQSKLKVESFGKLKSKK